MVPHFHLLGTLCKISKVCVMAFSVPRVIAAMMSFSLNLAPDPRFARPCFRSWGIRGNAGGICFLLPPRTWPKVGVQCWASGCDWGLWIHRLSHSSGAVEG